MPEGPELHLSSRFVNTSCKDRIFTGKVVKSEVHKSSEVQFEAKAYTICALSRGKEMQLILTKLDEHTNFKTNSKKKQTAKPKLNTAHNDDAKFTKILFRFGMSGKFEFTSPEKVHKHAHLKFFTDSNPPMVLSHVDVRRFGRWEVNADWSKQRGPDPMFDYQNFRSNVLTNLANKAFDHPICEVLLNQKYFNGIGNYLRAEILYRLRIPPFEKARTVLEGLSLSPPDAKPLKNGKKGRDDPDILHLCHTVPLEVVNMIGGGGYDPEGKSADYTAFSDWLQCYYQDGMSNMVDHNKRTIWFTGPAGPMVPKDGKSRSKKSKKRKDATNIDKATPSESAESSTKKLKRNVKQLKTTTTAKARKSSSTVKEENATQRNVSNTKPTSVSRRKAANSDDMAKKNTSKRRTSVKNDDKIPKKQTPARKKRNVISKATPGSKKTISKKKPTRKTPRTK